MLVRSSLLAATLLWALALAACSSSGARLPAAGQAFIAPLEHDLRQALTPRSPVVAKLRHGDRVEILSRRRRFYLVRTASGAEGWIDGRLLLSASGLDSLRRLRERAATAPSQGRASVMDVLNVHTAPHRLAPSFRRVQPGQHVDVIAYARVERKPYEPPPLIRESSASGSRPANGRSSRKKTASPSIQLLAPIPAPSLPQNWLELSRTNLPPAQQPPPVLPHAAAAQPHNAVTDDWALVRLEDGSAGWVLARMLFMDIPDEVAQYAERARIAACFRIGAVSTRSGEKPVWLWAAQSQRAADFDFDSLRIFVWNLRRNRYETAFIERNLRGWLPVNIRKGLTGAEAFQVIVEEKDGAPALRTYSLQPGSFRARLVSRAPASLPSSWLGEARPAPAPEPEPPPPPRPWLARFGDWTRHLRSVFTR